MYYARSRKDLKLVVRYMKKFETFLQECGDISSAVVSWRDKKHIIREKTRSETKGGRVRGLRRESYGVHCALRHANF